MGIFDDWLLFLSAGLNIFVAIFMSLCCVDGRGFRGVNVLHKQSLAVS